MYVHFTLLFLALRLIYFGCLNLIAYIKTNLSSFLELDAEVLKDVETLIQFKGVFVFTKEINEGAPLLTQIQPASLQVLKRLCGTLPQDTKHKMISKRLALVWMSDSAVPEIYIITNMT